MARPTLDVDSEDPLSLTTLDVDWAAPLSLATLEVESAATGISAARLTLDQDSAAAGLPGSCLRKSVGEKMEAPREAVRPAQVEFGSAEARGWATRHRKMVCTSEQEVADAGVGNGDRTEVEECGGSLRTGSRLCDADPRPPRSRSVGATADAIPCTEACRSRLESAPYPQALKEAAKHSCCRFSTQGSDRHANQPARCPQNK